MAKKPTKKQLEKYSVKFEKYLGYCQEYQMKLMEYLNNSLLASEGTTPPNGPKNPPKFP